MCPTEFLPATDWGGESTLSHIDYQLPCTTYACPADYPEMKADRNTRTADDFVYHPS
jgi:hypothetical protein